MSVARLGREVSSREFTQWAAYYSIYDDMKAGRHGKGEGQERGDDTT